MFTFVFLSLTLIITTDAANNILTKHIMPGGLEVPPIGLGSSDDLKKNDNQKISQFLNAIESGYRLIDTAYKYDNQRHLGLAIRQLMDTTNITRNDLIVVTKVWSTFHTRERAFENVKMELQDLQFDYSDFGLIHYPISITPHESNPREYFTYSANGSIQTPYPQRDVGYLEAWRGLEAAERLGLVKYIGLANFNIHQIKRILSVAVVKPVVVQVECHPLYRNDKLTNWIKAHNMSVMCYSPLRKCSPELVNNNVLQEVADKHKRTVYQVSLRWNMQRGHIVIPRSFDKHHQKENLDSLNFALDQQDMDKINAIPQLQKIIYPGNLLPISMPSHPDYPFGEDDDN